MLFYSAAQTCIHTSQQIRHMMANYAALVDATAGTGLIQSHQMSAACNRKHCIEVLMICNGENRSKEGKQGKGGKRRGAEKRRVVHCSNHDSSLRGDTQEREMLTLVWCWAASMMTPASSCSCLDSAALSARKRWATSPLSAVISPCTTNMSLRLMGMLLVYMGMLLRYVGMLLR